MERESCTGEEVVAMASTLIIIVLITIVGQKSLATTSPTPHLAMTIADVDVRIKQRRVVIDIVRGVDAATGVGTNLRRTIVARTTFFLEHDIDDTSTLSVFGHEMTVWGLGLGVEGAALGTLMAFVAAAIPLFYFAVFRSKILAWRQDVERFTWCWDYIRHACGLGAPMAFQYLLMNGAQVVSTTIVAPLGNIAIAANSFAITAESLCYMPGYGIGDAATTLIGQSVGARRADLCRSFAKMTVTTGMIVMALMGVVMYVFAPEMIGLLSPVDEIRTLGTEVLRIEAFAEPFFAAAIVSYSVCVGAGDTLRPSLINLGSMWFVRLTLAAAMAPHFGLRGVWVAMAIELTVRGLLFLWRIARGKWLKMD